VYRQGVIEAYQDGWRVWPPAPASAEAAREGDSGAQHAILAAGIPRLIAFYRGLGLPKADAEDVAADTCEAVVKYLPRLRDPVTFEAWFWKIARSKFNDHLRRNHRPRPDQGPDVSFDLPDEGLIVRDDHDEIRRAFLELTTRDRELLWMRDVIGLRYADISGRLRLTEGAIRVAVMRARRRLGEELGQATGD
jgi:RNA polymerase sigma-70 factor (ECF subfamily)